MRQEDLAVRLYYSTDPQALADRCLGELNLYTREDPMRRAFLIVPESMKADLERRYLEQHNRAGLMMAEVLSFSRLAHRLFSEAGGLAVKRISAAGKALLLQEILQQTERRRSRAAAVVEPEAQTALETDLDPEADPEQGAKADDAEIQESGEKYFRRFSRFVGKPGFAAELATVMGDFSRYRISPQDLSAAAAAAPSAITSDKLADFSLLLEQYRKILVQYELSDPDYDLDRLADLLREAEREPRLAFLRETAVWVLGFGETRAFTTQELTILNYLNRYCSSLTVTVSSDRLDEEGGTVYTHGRNTARQLRSISSRLTTKQVPPRRGMPAVTTVYAPNARAELGFVCGEIRRILVETDLQRRDIGIALADPETYNDLLAATARIYGLPVFIDRRTPLNQSSFLRQLDAVLEYLLAQPDREAIMSYLRAGFSGLPSETIDDFDNLCLARGLIRPRDFVRFKPEQLLAAGQLSDTELDLWNEVSLVLEPLNQLGSKIRQKRLGATKLELLSDWLQREVFARLEDRIAYLREQGEEEAARILTASWNQWFKFLEEAETFMQSLTLSQADFTRLLRAALAGFSHSSIPMGIDSIRAGNLRQLTTYPIEVLFIVGTSQDNFPPRSTDEGYLRDNERLLLAEHSRKIFPSHQADLPLAREWQLQQLLTAPRRHLYLTSPSLNRDEISLVQKQLEEQVGAETILLSDPFAPSSAWNVTKMAQRQLNLALVDPVARYRPLGDREVWLEALQLLDSMAGLGLQPERRPELLQLPQELVQTLILPRDRLSVSQLQRYNSCPYSYLATYLLRLHERENWQPSAREQGSLLHAVMELSIKELMASWQEVVEPVEKAELAQDWQAGLTTGKLEQYYETAVETAGLMHFGFPEVQGQMKRRILSYALTTLQLTADQIKRDLLFPKAVEWKFPLPERDNLKLTSGDWQVTLTGTIDRIDTAGNDFVLIDYKRGRRQIFLADLVHGLNLQLPLYLKVCSYLYPKAAPRGFGYFTFADRRSDNRQGIMPVSLDPAGLLRDSFDKQKLTGSTEELLLIADYAVDRAQTTMADILSGELGAKPTVLRTGQSPCSYCQFKVHCLYDGRSGRDRVQIAGTPGEYEARAKEMIRDWQCQQKEKQRKNENGD
jgi:ATP-dependent helicase/nuclease subunit B